MGIRCIPSQERLLIFEPFAVENQVDSRSAEIIRPRASVSDQGRKERCAKDLDVSDSGSIQAAAEVFAARDADFRVRGHGLRLRASTLLAAFRSSRSPPPAAPLPTCFPSRAPFRNYRLELPAKYIGSMIIRRVSETRPVEEGVDIVGIIPER